MLSLTAKVIVFRLLYRENEVVYFDNILKGVTNFKLKESDPIGEVVAICKLLLVSPAAYASV